MIHPPRTGRRALKRRTRPPGFRGPVRGVLVVVLVTSVLGAGPAQADDLPAILHSIFGSATDAPAPPQETPATLIAAGDIADCSSPGDEATANLLDDLAGSVATLGDNAYESGASDEFAECYGPTWGRHKARTHPVPGNHEYATTGASGYYGYFGSAASPLDTNCTSACKGYYSWDVPNSNWRVFVLNSNCSESGVGGCTSTSAQYVWLSTELDNANTAGKNVIAMWHHARYSSGTAHGSNTSTDALWDLLVTKHADLVLVGHEHLYERGKRIGTNDSVDSTNGIREFVVGTGGRDGSNYDCGTLISQMEKCVQDEFGVFLLKLYSDRYEWQFINTTSGHYTESGSQDVNPT